jgi:hypothetical protein
LISYTTSPRRRKAIRPLTGQAHTAPAIELESIMIDIIPSPRPDFVYARVARTWAEWVECPADYDPNGLTEDDAMHDCQVRVLSMREAVDLTAIPITFQFMAIPNRSKGWARFRALVEGDDVLDTASGTPWGSGRVDDTRHTRPLPPGTGIDVEMHVELIVGKNRRKEFSRETIRLVVEPGASAEVEHRPGSQGLRLAVTGARAVDE